MSPSQSISSTGTQDGSYNLISVLYHSLQAAETCEQYIADASDDTELSQFFRDVQEQNRELADRAKVLLKDRLGSSTSPNLRDKRVTDAMSNAVDEQSKQSFPASDAPAY